MALGLALGCSYPEFAFDPQPIVDSAVVDSTEVAVPCELPVGGAKQACTSIPHLKSGPPLCGVTATLLNTTNAATHDPATLPPSTDYGEIYAAWTNEALFVHAHIVDAKIVVVPEGGLDIYNGDSLEVFVATSAPKTGNYADDHGLQIDVSPPSG